MKIILSIFLLLLLNNCSLNKSKDVTSMTVDEYKLYIEDCTKKSNYPDSSK